MNKGLPSVRRWMNRPHSSSRAAWESGGANRTARYRVTSAVVKKPSGKPLHCAWASNSRTRARNGCALAITSAGRYVPTTRSRAGARRRASIASRSTVEGSLQCRSSSHRMSGDSAVSASSASDNCRAIRSGVAPWPLRLSRSSSASSIERGHLNEPSGRLPAQERE